MSWHWAATSVIVIALAFLAAHLGAPYGEGDALSAVDFEMPARRMDRRFAAVVKQRADWSQYKVRAPMLASGSEQENEERLLRYDRSLRRLLHNLKPGSVFAKDRIVYLEAVYLRFLELEPEFRRVPREIQKSFFEIEFQYERDRLGLRRFEKIHKLASEWKVGP